MERVDRLQSLLEMLQPSPSAPALRSSALSQLTWVELQPRHNLNLQVLQVLQVFCTAMPKEQAGSSLCSGTVLFVSINETHRSWQLAKKSWTWVMGIDGGFCGTVCCRGAVQIGRNWHSCSILAAEDQSVKPSNLSRKKRAIHLQVKGHALVIAVFSLLPKSLVLLDLACLTCRTCVVSGCSGIEPLVFNTGFFLAGDAGRAHFPETATGTWCVEFFLSKTVMPSSCCNMLDNMLSWT